MRQPFNLYIINSSRSGMRRVGKSTLLSQIIHDFYNFEDIYYFNFEDERLIHFESSDFNNLFEIFLELFGEKNEFLHFQGYTIPKGALSLTTERGLIKKYFHEYLKCGGMPEYLKYKDQIILKRIYDDILYRDIVARYEIKAIKALRELGLYYLTNISGLFSYNKLKQMLMLGSVNTVKSYTDYLENSFLLFSVNRFSYSLKQQFIAQKKIYCIDNGLADAISFQFS